MITGGNATIFVSDMDASVAFYTEVLGLTLRFRAENNWAEVVAGNELVLGLHPAHSEFPDPGTRGSVQIGLNVDEPLETIVERLGAKGVSFEGPVVEDKNGGMRFQYFADPDGNVLYFWEMVGAAAS